MLKKLLITTAIVAAPLVAFASEPGMKHHKAASHSYSNNPFYFRVDGGYAFRAKTGSGLKKAHGYAGEIGTGMYLNDKFRSDVTLFYSKTKQMKDTNTSVLGTQTLNGKIRSYGLFLNGYFDVADLSGFTPYIQAGVGYSRNQANLSGTYLSANGFQASKKKHGAVAYQAGVGVAYHFTDTMALDLSYRYRVLGKSKIKASTANTAAATAEIAKFTKSLKEQTAFLGLRFDF